MKNLRRFICRAKDNGSLREPRHLSQRGYCKSDTKMSEQVGRFMDEHFYSKLVKRNVLYGLRSTREFDIYGGYIEDTAKNLWR